jgi:hypothetical protein
MEGVDLARCHPPAKSYKKLHSLKQIRKMSERGHFRRCVYIAIELWWQGDKF